MVDLIVPHKLHKKTAQLPLLPVKRIVEYSELSTTQQENLNRLGRAGKTFLSQPKIILDLANKESYVLHFRSLRYYLNFGIELKRVIKVIEFTEAAVIKDYIELNIELRNKAPDKSSKDIPKLGNNAIFGKALQQNEKLTEAKFSGNKESCIQLVKSARFRDFLILHSNLSLVFLKPRKIVHDKVIQIGFSVLEYAKIMFYRQYYEQLVPAFHSRGVMAYMDTDSSIISIVDDKNTFLDDLYNARDFLDFSKIARDSDLIQKYPSLYKHNEGRCGLWKIETINLQKACFLGKKNYALQDFGKYTEFRCKGIPARSLNGRTFEDYERTIRESSITKLPVESIRSINHQLYKVRVNKVAFSFLDVSRVYPTTDVNFSLPFFHHKLLSCTCKADEED